MDAFFASAAEYFQGKRLRLCLGVLHRVALPCAGAGRAAAVALCPAAAEIPAGAGRRAWLVMPDGNQLPLTHWENILGRAKGCDIVVDSPDRFAHARRPHAL